MIVKVKSRISGAEIDVDIVKLLNDIENKCGSLAEYKFIKTLEFEKLIDSAKVLIDVVEIMKEQIKKYSVGECENGDLKVINEKLRIKCENLERYIEIMENDFAKLVEKYESSIKQLDEMLKKNVGEEILNEFNKEYDSIMRRIYNPELNKEKKRMTACKFCDYKYGTKECKAVNSDLTWFNGDIIKCDKAHESKEDELFSEEVWGMFLKKFDLIAYELVFGNHGK